MQTSDGIEKPLINLNGTSADELLEQALTVKRHLIAAQMAMRSAYPHGRDYQGDRPMAIDIARRQFDDKAAELQTVLDYFEALALHAYKAANPGVAI